MKNQQNLELSEFRLQLARELIEEYGSMRPQTKGRPSIDCPIRLTARHFIAFIPGNNVKKRCFVCSHTVTQKEIGAIQRFFAQIVMLHCVIPTVKEYHTLKVF